MKRSKCFNKIVVANHRKKAMIGKAFSSLFVICFGKKTLDFMI